MIETLQALLEIAAFVVILVGAGLLADYMEGMETELRNRYGDCHGKSH